MTNAQKIAALTELCHDSEFLMYIHPEEQALVKRLLELYTHDLVITGDAHEPWRSFINTCLDNDTEPYMEYLKSEKWREFRKKIIEEKNSTCEICGLRTNDTSMLHVHHLNYETLGHETPLDVALLCVHCHERVHEVKELMKGFEKRLPEKYKQIKRVFFVKEEGLRNRLQNVLQELKKEQRKVLHEIESSEGSIANAYADAIKSVFIGLEHPNKPRLANIILETCGQEKHQVLPQSVTKLL